MKKRGIMSGLTKVGTGMGIMIMPLVASALINTFEWRNSYLILGALALVAVIPLDQLMRRNPTEMGLLPDGGRQSDTESLALGEIRKC